MSKAYANSGVDTDKNQDVVHGIEEYVRSTFTDNVVSTFGDFAGMYDLNGNILVTSTDGVGTKTIATIQTLGDDAFYSLGQDIVNHCVNDILVKGATPLFFLDYFASSSLRSRDVVKFVHGVSDACKTARCVLIGGETAEMPDVYSPGHVDIVGTIVGQATKVINGKRDILIGDCVIGLRSSGPHTNGYSLIRKLVQDLRPEDVAPHRSYLEEYLYLQSKNVEIKGMCHITGGGWVENITRVLPDNLAVDLTLSRPSLESIFTRVQEVGRLSDVEMLQVFNMGIGMLLVVDEKYKDIIVDECGGEYLGRVTDGEMKIVIRQVGF